jgi:hypothetical protein
MAITTVIKRVKNLTPTYLATRDTVLNTEDLFTASAPALDAMLHLVRREINRGKDDPLPLFSNMTVAT